MVMDVMVTIKMTKMLMIVMWMMMAMTAFDGRDWKWTPPDSQPLPGPDTQLSIFDLIKKLKSDFLK